MNYFEKYRSFGDDSLESDYESFLAAVERASSAECEASRSCIDSTTGWTNDPPRLVEEHLPIADRLWADILTKPNLSVSLLARL